MFNVGDLVTTLKDGFVGIIIDEKTRYCEQYCCVLWSTEIKPQWILGNRLSEVESKLKVS